MHGFPIERWAERSPRIRWPLVLLLIVALIGLAGGVTGCGGSGGGPEPDRSGATPDSRNPSELCQ